MIIVSDTSPLSNLAIVGYLSLLQQIYNKVIIPQGVAEELRNASDEENLIAGVLSLVGPGSTAIAILAMCRDL